MLSKIFTKDLGREILKQSILVIYMTVAMFFVGKAMFKYMDSYIEDLKLQREEDRKEKLKNQEQQQLITEEMIKTIQSCCEKNRQ